LEIDADHCNLDSVIDSHVHHHSRLIGETINTMTLGGLALP